jgi:hypothetical protein
MGFRYLTNSTRSRPSYSFSSARVSRGISTGARIDTIVNLEMLKLKAAI